jgi:hypothetical protein
LRFEDLGLIVMPLLALLFYGLMMPLPEDVDHTFDDSPETAQVSAEPAARPEYREPTTTPPSTPGSSLMQLAPLLLLGVVGYLVLLVIRGIGLPHRS